MGSNKYVGYVGGVAVAVGVGAAIAAAGQGVASADTGKSDSSSASDSAKTDAGPKKSTTGTTKRPKPVSKVNDKPSSAAASDTKSVASTPTSAKTIAADFEAVQVKKLQGLFTGHAAPRPAAATPSTTPETAAAVTTETTAAATAAATPTFTWNWNPFRWMPPEPAPQDMPGPIWTLEQSFIAVFPDLVKPVAREGFEFGYRLTQMVPWVNVIVPITNIVAELPDALAGDKAAAQRVINNLIVTINPVAVLYYGYNEVADFLNLEAPALQLQSWFIASLWNLFDPFALLHNRGESGLPLSTTTPPPDQVTPEAAATTTLAAAVQPSASDVTLPESSDPFRADDPRPYGMPTTVYNTEKALVAIFPADVQPVVRELYEASWRMSQIVPGLNAAVPIAELLPALYQGALGNRTAAQTAINNVLLTTTALSILYYGYDQLADLLNVEAEAQALKVEVYAAVWDQADPHGYLHVPGQSGLQTV
ncbi:hypothetical protein [Mycolicibacterium helvum]|uniref:Uncharacterized protein n=1 Tax=Mycolicibacterium helvum TaxID=1534349 RepID=A0A7I7T5U9_9MYCO|nr:hypothetical protein [Mycolicibacterium helvum]BBY63496.1 hypothetical protein MHEL_17390 [Mycolicibacterium helvum]